MKLGSPSFEHNQSIPALFTCEGEDVNPQLDIADIPENTKSLVLIVDDPDAPVGMWDHWVVFNIDPATKEIGENSVPEGAIQGVNSWGRNNWGGPCPPSGEHRYFFKLYSVDIELPLDETADKNDVEQAMNGHILDKTELIGLYKKSS